MPLTSQGLILLLAGILVLGLGFYFFLYTEFNWIWGDTYPYRTEGTVGIIVGFVLLAVGIRDMVRTPPAATVPLPPISSPQPTPSTTTGKRFCENCGAELSASAKYCPKCGQKT